VAKNDDGIVTNYLVDRNRDYGQVIKELDSANNPTVSYLYGDDLISQTRAANDSYYLYDGLGSARALSDASGAVTDSYDYDAWGQLIDSTGTTENSYWFAGEQYDAGLGQYYLRARYYDPDVGRFTSMDTFQGRMNDPVTLHKYLYANGDPTNMTDPSGRFGLVDAGVAATISGILVGATVYGNQIGQSLAGGLDTNAGYTPTQTGWLSLAALPGAQSAIYRIVKEKVKERNVPTVNLYRAVLEVEYLDILSCDCFQPSRSNEPKRFWVGNISYAYDYGNRALGNPKDWVVVSATVSKPFFEILDHWQMDEFIGETVTVHPPMLPAFNFEIQQYGGIRYH